MAEPKESKAGVKCSFCERDKQDTTVLIAGKRGHICDRCIEQALQLVKEELNERNSNSLYKSINLLKPAEIIGLFAKANPSFPLGSILVSCGHNRLTAIEACFAKDGLKPIACQGLHECHTQVVRVTPPAKNSLP